MVVFEVVDNNNGNLNITQKFTPFHSYLLGISCDENKAHCSPYKGTFTKGKYKVELWGAGSSRYHNGAYVSGEIIVEKTLSLYFFIGPERSSFNSVDIGNSNGTLGNGASDIRLFYDGNWSSFDSLKSRIIVAGAGGNQNGMQLGDVSGICNASGNYGFGGGLSGYSGINRTCSSSYETLCYPGFPGTQTSGGNGGFSGLCHYITGDGGHGKFGIGGLPGKACFPYHNYPAYDGYAGSGGYYGSGGSSGESSGHSSPYGTSGGSSFISGHRGCDAISFDSTEDNINHTGLPWHYSGIVFGNTLMIDGSGMRWTNETVGEKMRMPSVKDNKSYGEGNGHSGSGFIKIAVLSCKMITRRCSYKNNNIIFVLITYIVSMR